MYRANETCHQFNHVAMNTNLPAIVVPSTVPVDKPQDLQI